MGELKMHADEQLQSIHRSLQSLPKDMATRDTPILQAARW